MLQCAFLFSVRHAEQPLPANRPAVSPWLDTRQSARSDRVSTRHRSRLQSTTDAGSETSLTIRPRSGPVNWVIRFGKRAEHSKSKSLTREQSEYSPVWMPVEARIAPGRSAAQRVTALQQSRRNTSNRPTGARFGCYCLRNTGFGSICRPQRDVSVRETRRRISGTKPCQAVVSAAAS